jgi:hypothetical protein
VEGDQDSLDIDSDEEPAEISKRRKTGARVEY